MPFVHSECPAFLAVLVFSTALDVLTLDRENMRYTPLLLTMILCSLSYFGLRQSGMIVPAGEKTKQRLSEAEAANTSISEIAYAVGFNSV